MAGRGSQVLPGLICIVVLAGACSKPVSPGAQEEPAAEVHFTDITARAGLVLSSRSFGAVFSDIDHDGDDDLVVSRHGKGPALFLNQDGLVFSDRTDLLPVTRGDRHGITVADLDNDGDRDMVMAGGGADGVGKGRETNTFRNLLIERGELSFELVTQTSGLGRIKQYRARSLMPLASPDGSKIDLYMTCLIREGFPNEYYENRSDSRQIRFDADPDSALRFENSSEGTDLFVDIDRDGDQDLFIKSHQYIKYYRRDPDGFRLVESLISEVPLCNVIAAGDLNNDGFPEVMIGTHPPWDPSDDVCFKDGLIHFLVRSLDGDSHDSLSFRASGDELAVDMTFKPGLKKSSPEQIWIGRQKVHPRSASFTTTAEAAAGAPAETDSPGTYLWFDTETTTWHVRWLHSPETPYYRGSFSAKHVSEVELHDAETREAPRPARDRLFLNQAGRLVPWPEPPDLSHHKKTAMLVIEDFDNNGFADIIGIRCGRPSHDNGDPFILLNHGDQGFSVLTDNDLVNEEDDLYTADQLVSGLVNNDGLLDLFLTNGAGVRPGSSGPFKLYLNSTKTAHHYIALELIGHRSNRDALGAQVEVYGSDEDEHGEPALIGYRELGAGFHRSQRSHTLHFGLGNESGPVQVKVRWPAGTISWHELKVDQRHQIDEP